MQQKYFLLTALIGTVISANAFAVPGEGGNCGASAYLSNNWCQLCPSNYNNDYSYKTSIEECCIDELTYDSVSGMCVAVASSPNIASNANSATCDDTTIGATSGSTEMEAIWDANSITVNWYNGNTKITTNTCSYDGAVTIPATPTKAGYTFNGWHVRVTPVACSSISDITACNAQANCVYVGSACSNYASGTKCSAVTTSSECTGNMWSDGGKYRCEWYDNVCNADCIGGDC